MPLKLVLIAITALLGSLGFTAALTRFSGRLRLIAKPRADRWHSVPTANTGGIAIVLSVLLVYGFAGTHRYGLVAALSVLIALLGFFDDRLQLRPSVKFLGQSAIILCVIAAGIKLPLTGIPALDAAITFLWIAGITNAFNLIDNMDGLCAGVTVIICAFRLPLVLQAGDAAGAIYLLILGSAYAGFLFFNYKPARIFMGDCGSMFAGFTLATLTIASPAPYKKAFVSALICPALTFLYPIFDTILVSVLRRAAGRPVSLGGRDHSSHRLVSLGHSEKKVVWMLWILTAVGSALGSLTYGMPTGVYAIGCLLSVGAIVFGVFLGSLPGYAFPGEAPVHAPWIRRLIPTARAGATLAVDALLSGVALLLAFSLRWEDSLSVDRIMKQFLASLPLFMICHGAASVAFRTFNLGWRWFASQDLLILAKCSLASSCAGAFALWALGLRDFSRAVVLAYSFGVFCLCVGLRVLMRVLWSTLGQPAARPRRAVLLGLDNLTEISIIALRRQKHLGIWPVAVLTTNSAEDHTRIYGVPVRYVKELNGLMQKLHADTLVVSSSNISEQDQRILAECKSQGIPVQQFCVTLSSMIA